jgi:hypothetical protein
MANYSCLNTFLIYAKAKTIRQILDTCVVADPEAPEEMEVSFAKIFGYSPEEFDLLPWERKHAMCFCGDGAYDSTFATDIPPDDDTFTEYEMTCRTPNRSPINIASMLAYRFKCGVVLWYNERTCCVHGEYACHYNPDWETSDCWEENRSADTGNVLDYCTDCYCDLCNKEDKPESALNGRVLVDHFVTFPPVPCFENMGLPG